MPTNKELFTTSMNNLNDTINSKAGTTGKHTIDQMTTVVNSIVTGKTEQTKHVSLNMSSGDQYISPDTDKVMTLVTVEKPATLIAENIKKNVNIDVIHNIECCPKFPPIFVIVGTLDDAAPPAATTNTDDDQLNNARTTAIFTHKINAQAIIVITNFFNESII